MKKVKADILAIYLNESMAVFSGIQQQLPEDKKIMEEYKRKFCEGNFTRKYEEFEEELRHNILEYRNITIVFDYIVSCLGDSSEGFVRTTNQQIIKKGIEVTFLLKLKLSIEGILGRIDELCACNCKGNPKAELSELYEETLKNHATTRNKPATDVDNDTTERKITTMNQTHKPYYDERLDFDLLKTEIDGIRDAKQRLQVVRDRLYDVREWQIRYDKEETDAQGRPLYPLSEMYYPKMHLLCNMEMERIEKVIEYEKNTSLLLLNRAQPEADKPAYSWNATDIDLLELSTALLMTNTITRKDGRKMTQKELKEAFEQMFGLEIKDAKVKLLNAMQRKRTMAPFLESLKTAFEEYTKERM